MCAFIKVFTVDIIICVQEWHPVAYSVLIGILLLSVLSAIPGNITSSLLGIVDECVARVNNAMGNERVMFPWYCAQNRQ